MRGKKVPQGLIVYDGPSMLTGDPILGIITTKTRNPKTGRRMMQLWIVPKGVHPVKAIKTGQDRAVCGNCPLRGWTRDGRRQRRRCYVNPLGPGAVYSAYRRRRYRKATPILVWRVLSRAGVALRLGAWGDPAALPRDLVATLTAFVTRWTGYTHQWREIDPAWSRYVMASADSAEDRAAARALGYRCFRVRRAADPVLAGEVTCPAAAEAGKRTTCDRCGLCAGNAGRWQGLKDVVLQAHGAARRFFELTPVLA